ncbi:hypothetical protein SUGI_0309190 [Cryptomeria japonica]|uniref:E3 ubiquitin ligase PQT3-like isoform X1 n=1 Tax=Cryptomeria japonica TaxID=3369 RepID=UPI002408A8A1|nr:E3 ubiquitin ligase PQT3-like isoform X1 [Cryptomeria japonica]GLJ17719.1 hypothetical protein SUGI_0309190 [Cryptomeria japonica]
MAVYYKFKSAKDYDSVPIEGQFISVAILKEKIFESKHLGRGTDFDLVISNAQTNEEYLDEGMLVPKNTSVLVRRVPGRPRMPIVTEKKEEPKEIEIPKDQVYPSKNGFLTPDQSQFKFPDEESEWDEFGNDLYALPEVPQVLQTQTQSQPIIPNKADEDSKIRAFVDSTASDWQRQTQESYAGRGYGRGSGGRGLAGRGFGRGMERKTPPQGYVCHRCKVPGHFIQHCPTNGDPNFDIKRVKPPTGIPKSMLVANPDGSYALPSGAVAVLRPNEAAFEKEVEGLPSGRSVGDLPPELHCPLCKEVMKDAVLTSKCCFKSYCDKCIRDYILSKSKCICGATSILADDLLPNMTLRDAINRILETTTSSAENAGSWLQVQDMESARCPRPKLPSPSLSGCTKEVHTVPAKSDVPDLKEENIREKTPVNMPQQSSERNRSTKIPEQLEETPESMSTKELLSQESAPMVGEEVQQKPAGSEPVKKKKKKRARQLPSSNETQWRGAQDFGAEGSIMPYAPTSYNPFWPATQWGADGYMASAGSIVPFMGYGQGPCDTSFGAMVPSDMYAAQGYMQGFVPPVQRDYIDYGMNTYDGGRVMSREEFEARKADLRKKREQEQRHNSRDHARDISANGGDVVLPKHKLRVSSQATATLVREDRGLSTERHRESEPSQSPRSQTKRKADRDDFQMKEGRYPTDGKLDSQVISDVEMNKTFKPSFAGRADKKQKGSVFSRISFPEDASGQAKKRNIGSHDGTNGFRDHESTFRNLNSSKSHYDDGNPVKRVVNGRRYMHDDDLSDRWQ